MQLNDFEYIHLIDNAETGFRLEYKTKTGDTQVYQLYAESADEAKFEAADILQIPEANLPQIEAE